MRILKTVLCVVGLGAAMVVVSLTVAPIPFVLGVVGFFGFGLGLASGGARCPDG